MAKRVLVLNGPNLNMLGAREPGVYGTATLADIERLCQAEAATKGLSIDFRQTNHEGELVTWVQQALGAADAIVINPGAYTHTSISLHDALRAVGLPVIEVHLSNIFAREAFRHHSYVSPVALGVICGLGVAGYKLAIDALADKI